MKVSFDEKFFRKFWGYLGDKPLPLRLADMGANFLLYALIDIMASHLSLQTQHASYFYFAWSFMLMAMMFRLILRYGSIALASTLWFASYNGTEDLIYFLLQGRLPSHWLPWLTSPMVLQPATDISTYVGVVATTIFAVCTILIEKRLGINVKIHWRFRSSNNAGMD